ncbi:hypothetical protein GEO21_04910 [Sphingobacterium faecium]|uniref:hypothetical protein n=1 Tax=Sphingobacterium faecium TaxID=34087 RepID=UPI00129098C9|nr:hypothetical protein [Sphingobacterium faecium]MQP26859.1 hypothetical protein [Sphingobacterium faecium]
MPKISYDGYPSGIYNLTEFLKDDIIEIRETACTTIIHLFKKINRKKGYYGSLKYADISESDIDFYETNFAKELHVELLAISSLKGSGYVRGKAVKKLSQADATSTIQFLIYRLTDWVLSLNQSAQNGL